MRPHPRLRKTIKWTGAAVTLLLLVVWAWSLVWWYWTDARGVMIVVRHGLIAVSVHQPSEADEELEMLVIGSLDSRSLWMPDGGRGPTDWFFLVPLWCPLLVSFVSTTLAWRLDTLARRRARLNNCPKCNYDRAGIGKDAVCPECGARGTAAPGP